MWEDNRSAQEELGGICLGVVQWRRATHNSIADDVQMTEAVIEGHEPMRRQIVAV